MNKQLFQAHPWHGVTPGPRTPELVNAFIEIVPTDVVKYELDKWSGHLRVDRPQRFSSMSPTLYGFIPQTYCGPEVAELCERRTGRKGIQGDKDPMDICVLSEKTFAYGGFFLHARPIGGLRMIDGNQADDKIIAVLKGDVAFGHIRDISEVPEAQIDRLKHYFLTYKRPPGAETSPAVIADGGLYGREEAWDVIQRSRQDYQTLFPNLQERLLAALRNG